MPGIIGYLGAALGRRSGGQQLGGPRPKWRVGDSLAIVLLRPSCAAGRMIDRSTGGDGYSHCILDLQEVDAGGNRIVVDCHPGWGVVRVPSLRYRYRQSARIMLDPWTASQGRRIVNAYDGAPYHIRDDDACSCATLAVRVMPDHYRREVLSERYKGAAGDILSPNRIYRALRGVCA